MLYVINIIDHFKQDRQQIITTAPVSKTHICFYFKFYLIYKTFKCFKLMHLCFIFLNHINLELLSVE